MNNLTITELTDLKKLEATITKHEQVFVMVGNALLQIQERRLYRKDYGSFQEYCEQRWGWARQHAHRMIQAAAVVNHLNEQVSPMGDTIPNERVAREVSKVPKEKRAAVVKEAAKSGAVTTKTVAAAAKVIEAEEVITDEVGREIPPKIQQYWNRAEEIRNIMRLVKQVKLLIERAKRDNDLMFAEINDGVTSDLERAYHSIECGIPYAVCTQCQGHPESQPKGQCRLCLGRGLISKFRWRTVPEEVRKMVEKGKK